MGNANANCLQIFKNAAQNSPKHAISSEKNLFFAGEEAEPPPRPLTGGPTSLSPNESVYASPRIPARITPVTLKADMHYP